MFVGKDVATALGYTNTQKAIRDHVDDDDKLTERFVLSGSRKMRHPWWSPKNNAHQRERSLLADSLFQAATGEGVQALGNQ